MGCTFETQLYETSTRTAQKIYRLQTRSHITLYFVIPSLSYCSFILRKNQVTLQNAHKIIRYFRIQFRRSHNKNIRNIGIKFSRNKS